MPTTLQINNELLHLRFATPSEWTETVLAEFDLFLNDHAQAEKSIGHGDVNALSLP